MKASIALLGALAALKDDLVLVELTLFNGDINLDDILPDDATCTDVEVTDVDINFSQYVLYNRCTYPTSELPMRPSLRPTAIPCARSVRWLWSLEMVSVFAVFAAAMASPFISFSGAIPQPSWTLHPRNKQSMWQKIVVVCAHEADFVLDLDHLVRLRGQRDM